MDEEAGIPTPPDVQVISHTTHTTHASCEVSPACALWAERYFPEWTPRPGHRQEGTYRCLSHTPEEATRRAVLWKTLVDNPSGTRWTVSWRQDAPSTPELPCTDSNCNHPWDDHYRTPSGITGCSNCRCNGFSVRYAYATHT